MTEYIAMLRRVNVGGRTLKMEQLRTWLGSLGLANVRTYVQSGNAVFAAKGEGGVLARKIEAAMARELSQHVPVILKTSAELGAVIKANPFSKEGGIDPSKLHVTFLSSSPTKEGLSRLAAIDAGPDRWRAHGTEIYLHCPKGYGRTKLANGAIERALATTATTRNWNSVNKLY